jgi:hypothetical protein
VAPNILSACFQPEQLLLILTQNEVRYNAMIRCRCSQPLNHCRSCIWLLLPADACTAASQSQSRLVPLDAGCHYSYKPHPSVNEGPQFGAAHQTCSCHLRNSNLLLLQIRTTPAEIMDYFDHFLRKKPQGVIDESHVHLWSATLATRDGIYTFTFSRACVKSRCPKLQARFSFVYHQENGVWKIVEHHSSVMPEQTLATNKEVRHAAPHLHCAAALAHLLPSHVENSKSWIMSANNRSCSTCLLVACCQ